VRVRVGEETQTLGYVATIFGKTFQVSLAWKEKSGKERRFRKVKARGTRKDRNGLLGGLRASTSCLGVGCGEQVHTS